ncbi:beta-glucan synthesis-associated protein-domain-containing protein [Crucibulum laeve]|uniref:Beta-glucan synthesis-associated protein-domain-containing protein n=1 Tax=Crucibulum laeve TaxID=68775 RepID=A0A5C3LRR0_9AGAR|nr:beta-glucan synthesis-associated protein-domain-containing protein [Crucibulum laeve]
MLHDPSEKGGLKGDKGHFPWRGLLNVGVLLLLILGLLCLFVFYPVMTFYRDQARNNRIDGNIRINATGQAPVLFQMPEMIDSETPDSAKTRTGFDGNDYELVFSDEFNTDGRTFWPGDDPFWEAVDLWYGATGDLEWYDPQQVTTRDGALVITMDSTSTTQAGLTPENHLLDYRSGMLQTWNKFCFTSGYIEVAVTFPGPNEDTQGYWPGAWTMGNLARPGYSATTDGMWPYTYDSCDVGTLPNQTNVDGLGPPAALHSDFSRDKYNNELSWLSGQRLSACSCPGGDHPGPGTKGRGAPEIDIFEASKDKQNPHGQTVSQSAQFAPFSHDYIYLNATADEWEIFDPDRTRPNTYHGSAVQQSVSGVVKTPSDMFQGSGTNFKTFGFEYFADPKNRDNGYIMWQVDGQPSHRVWAKAVGPDQGPDGSGVGQRLIPEEPMSIILNLGISESWQTIDLSTMSFPSEMKFDYVRVYQRKGSVNTGCNPPDYPTADYITNHLSAYQDVNKTKWDWEIPRNSMVRILLLITSACSDHCLLPGYSLLVIASPITHCVSSPTMKSRSRPIRRIEVCPQLPTLTYHLPLSSMLRYLYVTPARHYCALIKPTTSPLADTYTALPANNKYIFLYLSHTSCVEPLTMVRCYIPLVSPLHAELSTFV